MSEQTAVQVANGNVMADNSIVVRRDKGGEIRSVSRSVKLSVDDGTLVRLPMGGTDGTLIPSARGFTEMAASCGVVITNPPVFVDGREYPSPHQDKDGKIWARSVAYGRTALGTLYATNKVVIFDADLYNIQDLLAKAKKTENAPFFQIRPFQGAKDNQLIGSPEQGKWVGYPLDQFTVLWVDCSCPQFIGWYGEMVNRRKNAIRTAQTFADRNALAAHPALPAQRKFKTPTAVIPCKSWFSKDGNILDSGKLGFLGDKMLAAGQDVEIEKEQVITLAGASPEDLAVIGAEARADVAEPVDAVTGDDEPEDAAVVQQGPEPVAGAAAPAPAPAPAPAAQPEPANPRMEMLMSVEQLRRTKPNLFKAVCNKLELDPTAVDKADTATLAKLIERVSSQMKPAAASTPKAE